MQQSLLSGFATPRRWTGLAAAALVAAGVGYGVVQFQAASQTEVPVEVAAPTVRTVTALGRLEPQGEVVKLSAPSGSSGNRVEQLLVQEGDTVKAGQVIAVLDTHNRLAAAYAQAQETVKVAQAQLAITQAGAKQGEIEAQKAEIARLEAQRQGDLAAQNATVARLSSELQNAQTEFVRYQALHQAGAISASDLDARRLALDTAQNSVQEARAVLTRIQATRPAELNQAQANLARIVEVRPVEVQASRAELEQAIAAMKQAKAELDQAFVKAPIAGEVLDIHTRAGEVVSNDGIAEIGQTGRMYTVAEVYESDISRVQPGQSVRVTSDSIPTELQGTVERIDSQVRRQAVVNTDPSTNIDARVIEVHIALDETSSQLASKFTNLQVTAEIKP